LVGDRTFEELKHPGEGESDHCRSIDSRDGVVLLQTRVSARRILEELRRRLRYLVDVGIEVATSTTLRGVQAVPVAA